MTATSQARAAIRAVPRHGAQARRRTIIGYIFIAPFILGFLFWFLFPMLTAVWLIFQDWNLIAQPRYIGLHNVQRLFGDRLFYQSLKVTAIYSFSAVPLGLVAAFLVALLMNSKVRGITVFRVIYYLPSIVPAVANAVLWAWLLNAEFGLINVLLRYVGLPRVLWLQQPAWAIPALVLMSLWGGIGSSMIIYLAGLQGIPDVYYEAAQIDGAGGLRKLWHITIPLMSPVIFFNLVMGIIGSFQVFTPGYLLTDGGPSNATLFYVLYLYRNAFEYLEMGYAAALSWVLFVIIVIMTAFIFKGIGGRIYYESAEP